jgi:hypothetical protein
MNQLIYKTLFSFLLLSSLILAQTLTRTAEIKEPSGLERGFGGVIAGVDFDGDGLPEIYACNSNFVDGDYELVPRLYKFEWNPTTSSWDSVWCAVIDGQLQNTWPALAWGDLDKDGKPEIYWAPVNYSPYPDVPRIFVFEYPGDGSDNMGVSDGFGGWLPNSSTDIEAGDGINLRPVKFVIGDPDNDGTDELIFADRNGYWMVGILSVSDIPDDANGLEEWTTEFTGKGDINLDGVGSMWDVFVLNNFVYVFDGNLTDGSKVWGVKFSNGVYESLPGQSGIAGGNSSWKASQVVDLDKDGTKEVLVAEWLGNTIGQGARVWLLQQDGDTLTSTELADLESLGAVRLNTSAVGDIDGDGFLDLAIGSRYDANNTAKVPIFMLSYKGGDITSPANYQASIIDSAYWNNNGDMEVYVGNVDGDPADEVLYTQGYSRGNNGYPNEDPPVPSDVPMPLVVLDKQLTPVSVEKEKDIVPAQFYLDQNFPNPFNPSTSIKFGIKEASNVDLRIYDALGREVAVLISNQFMNAGAYNVKFDAGNLASGTYIYRITAGNNTVSRKMQLLK